MDVLRHKAFTKPGEDTFDSLEAANEHFLNVCRGLNNAPLSDGRIPSMAFEEEKPFLMEEVPEFSCFSKRVGCRVDKYSTVPVNGVHYREGIQQPEKAPFL